MLAGHRARSAGRDAIAVASVRHPVRSCVRLLATRAAAAPALTKHLARRQRLLCRHHPISVQPSPRRVELRPLSRGETRPDWRLHIRAEVRESDCGLLRPSVCSPSHKGFRTKRGQGRHGISRLGRSWSYRSLACWPIVIRAARCQPGPSYRPAGSARGPWRS
jgi:hypothetical protein